MEEKDQLQFRFTKSEDYHTVPATGVWGGLMVDGSVFASFFVDQPPTPDSVTHEISEGKLGSEIGRTGGQKNGKTLNRCLQVGIVMKPERARSIGRWLISKADEFDVAQKEVEGG